MTLALLAALTIGCARVKLVYRDPQFAAGSVASGRIGIGGVTPVESLVYMEQDRIAEALRKQLHTKWPGAQVLGAAEVRKAIGPKLHERMLEAFDENGNLQRPELKGLSSFSHKVRYLALINIEQNHTSHWGTSGPQYDEDYSYNSVTGDYDHYSTFAGYMAASGATRSILCTVMIYDLQRLQSVWVVSGARSVSDSNSASHRSMPVEVSQMEAPATSTVMDWIIERAVRKLPE